MTRGEVRWIGRLWRPFAVLGILIVSLTIVNTIARVVLPLVLKRTFDGFETHLTAAGLVSAVLLYLALGTFEWMGATGLIFMRGSMNLKFEMAARLNAYARLVHHAPGFFQKYRTGDLVTRLTDDVSEKLSWFICSGIFRCLAAILVVVFGVVMMLRLDPFLTLCTVGPLPLLILLFIKMGTVLDRRFDDVQQRISEMNGALEACFSGIRVVKAYGRENAEERSFERFAAECRRAEIAAARSQTLVDSMFGHVWQLGVVAVLLAGGIGVMSGRLTLGTFVAFDAYVLMLIFPMFDIGTFFVRGRQSGVSIARLRELEETSPEIAEDPHARTLARADIEGRLRFEGLGYAYATPAPAPSAGGNGHLSEVASGKLRAGGNGSGSGNGAPMEGGAANGGEIAARPGAPPLRLALDGITFEVRPGEIVAVVGTVGSGKSTLLRLVPRLMDPTRGRALLDDVDLRALALDSLRGTVGYVPQEALLFSGTIRDNIRFGREGVGEARVLEACDVARLGKDLAGFSHGLDTRVGVRGLALSGGQKQRVALARALAGRPRILVLDDVTAALDAETESALWEELHRVLPDLATLVVTHRTATLERADRILVLDGGRLVEEGTHAELSERGPVYRSIYRRHTLEERVTAECGADPLPDAEREAAPETD